MTASSVYNPWALISKREHHFIPGLTLCLQSHWEYMMLGTSPRPLPVGSWQLLSHQALQLLLSPALGRGHTAVSSGTCVCFHTTLLKPCELGKWQIMLRGVGVFSVGPTKPHPSRSLGFYPTKDGTLLFIGRSRDWPAVGPRLSLFPGFPHSPVGSEKWTIPSHVTVAAFGNFALQQLQVAVNDCCWNFLMFGGLHYWENLIGSCSVT